MLYNAKNGRIPVGRTDMDYVSFGYGSKVLVLLPGLSDALATLKGKALLLAGPYRRFFEKYTVYMFSRKNAAPDGYSIRDMAADQAAAMKLLGIESACVTGVSQGGMIAQYLAADFPELVEKLVIAVSAPYANDIVRDCVNTWLGMAKENDHRRLMIDTAEKSYSAGYLKRFRKTYPVIGLVAKPKSYHRFIVNANAILGFNARGEIGKIACPTLIIGGSDDKIVGVQASYEMKEKIPESRLHVYQGLGHAAYEEAPDFNERVFSFLEEEQEARQ